MSRLYSCNEVEQLMGLYGKKKNYGCYVFDEGSLGYGVMVLTADGCKSAVVTEVYLNSQSSAHKIRFYNVLPKKYAEPIRDGKVEEDVIMSWRW